MQFGAMSMPYLFLLLLLPLLSAVHALDVRGEALSLPAGDKLHGEGNSADLKIYFHSGTSVLEVRNAWLKWGKWVPGKGDFHKEIGSPNGMKMTAWGEYHIASAGRESSPSGTEASVDIYCGDERVVYLYWDVVWGGSPSFKREVFSDKFKVKFVVIGESHLDITVVFVEKEAEKGETVLSLM